MVKAVLSDQLTPSPDVIVDDLNADMIPTVSNEKHFPVGQSL